MRPSRLDHVKECAPIKNIPHAAEKKKRMWRKKVATYWCLILWGDKTSIRPHCNRAGNQPPDLYLFQFRGISEIRHTFRLITGIPFFGLCYLRCIWIVLGSRIRLILFVVGINVHFCKSKIFLLHFFEIFLISDLLLDQKKRFQAKKPKSNVKCWNDRWSCNPCHDFSNVL